MPGSTIVRLGFAIPVVVADPLFCGSIQPSAAWLPGAIGAILLVLALLPALCQFASNYSAEYPLEVAAALNVQTP